MSSLFRKAFLLLILTISVHAAAMAQEISYVSGEFRLDFAVYDSDNSLCELTNIVQINDPRSVAFNPLKIPATVSYNDREYTVARIGNMSVFRNLPASGINFEDNPTLLSGLDLSYFFSSCPNLVEVVGLEGITEIAPYMFYDCPQYSVSERTVPESVTKIGEYAFALSGEPAIPEERLPMGSIIGANIREIAANSFENRIVGSVTISPGSDTLHIAGGVYPFLAQAHNIYRNMDCTAVSYNSGQIAEVINALNTNFVPLGSSNTALKQVYIDGVHADEVSLGDCPELAQLIVVHSTLGSLHFSCGVDSKLEQFVINNSRIGELGISETPVIPDMTGLEIEKLFVYGDWPAETIDLSGVKCFGDDQKVNLQAGMGGNGVKKIIFPDNLCGYASYNNWPDLENVYLGKDIAGIDDFNNYSHEVVFGGDVKDWCGLTFNGGDKADWSVFRYSWPDMPLRYVTKLWYGDGRNKTNCVEDLVLTGVDKISDYAFAGYRMLKSVKISGNTEIGECAFSKCNNLKTIDIDGCDVGVGAFGKSSYVTQITIGGKTKSFAPYSFYQTGLNATTRVDYKGKPSQWASIGFNAVDDMLEGRPYTFYAGINPAWIANGGFYIQNKIVEILEFDEVIERVAAYAFSSMSSLKEVRFKDKAPAFLDDNCFSNCTLLSKVIVYVAPMSRAAEATVSGITIGTQAFYNDSKLAEVSFLDDIEDIGAYAFEGTQLLENAADGPVYIGSVLYTYGGTAPANTVLEVRDGTTVLCANSLMNQSGISGLVLPESLLKVEEGALYGTSLEGCLVVPGNVSVFASEITSAKLTKVIFEDSEKPLYQTAPAAGIEELYMGRNFVPVIKYYTDDEGCKRIQEIIGNEIATGSKMVTFGPKVTEIPLYTFPTDMWNLTTLRSLNPEPPVLPAFVFDDSDREWTIVDRVNPGKVVLEVPSESIEKYRNAEGWNQFLTISGLAGITTVPAEGADAPVKGYYNTLGVFSTVPFAGLNIEVRADGTRRKVLHSL